MPRPSMVRRLLVETLEDRVVQSQLGALSNATAPLDTPARTTARVSGAYKAFVQSFDNAINVDLYMPSMTGSGGSNTPFFSQQLGESLTTLDRNVVKAIGHVPAGSPAAVQIRKSILGPGADSLRSRLSALTMASAGLGSSITAYQNAALQEIRQNFVHVNQQILASPPASTPSRTAP